MDPKVRQTFFWILTWPSCWVLQEIYMLLMNYIRLNNSSSSPSNFQGEKYRIFTSPSWVKVVGNFYFTPNWLNYCLFQVELETLRKELSEKDELLVETAKAMDVLQRSYQTKTESLQILSVQKAQLETQNQTLRKVSHSLVETHWHLNLASKSKLLTVMWWEIFFFFEFIHYFIQANL